MKILLSPAFLLLGGCATTIGTHNDEALHKANFGQDRVEIRICTYLDTGITEDRARALLDTWNQTEADKYGIYVRPVSFSSKPRTEVFYHELKPETQQLSLKDNCDKAMWFIGRNVFDYTYGLAALMVPLPEIMGYADDETLTKSYVVARTGSLSQAILFAPKNATVHEMYHLLGCGQHGNMKRCYRQLKELKTAYRKLKGVHFWKSSGIKEVYPTYGGDRIMFTRLQIEKMFPNIVEPK